MKAARDVKDGEVAVASCRFVHIRYADTFIIFVWGSKEDAEEIRVRVGRFLSGQLALTSSVIKSGVVHLKSEKLSFLGYQL
jgi:hypothetical protein